MSIQGYEATISFNSQPPEGGWLAWEAAGKLLEAFQLTAARRRLGLSGVSLRLQLRFQLTAARRRLVRPRATRATGRLFQLTAARRRLVWR